MSRRSNLLFVVLDQWRADTVFGSLALHVPTPAIDRLLWRGTAFLQHYSVASPCGPARASLLTGRYAEHHGALRNGNPIRSGLTNLALELRKLGREPLLFGYTDTQPDPALLHANDPDLAVYENLLPGFRELVEMRLEHGFEWPGWLRQQGYPVPLPLDTRELYRPVDGRLGSPAIYASEHSDAAYLTDRTLASLDIRRGDTPWTAHLTYIRPHPPWVAPAPWHKLVNPDLLPPANSQSLEQLPIRPVTDSDHRILSEFSQAWYSAPSHHGMFHGFDGQVASLSGQQIRLMRASYLDLLAEVDHHLNRVWQWLDASGQTDDTLIVLTADHGELLGDHGFWGKDSFFRQAFHVPLILAGPGIEQAQRIEHLTESTDVMPTILDLLGGQVPADIDGRTLTPLLRGERPRKWRSSVHGRIALDRPEAPTRFERYYGVRGLYATLSQDAESCDVSFAINDGSTL